MKNKVNNAVGKLNKIPSVKHVPRKKSVYYPMDADALKQASESFNIPIERAQRIFDDCLRDLKLIGKFPKELLKINKNASFQTQGALVRFACKNKNEAYFAGLIMATEAGRYAAPNLFLKDAMNKIDLSKKVRCFAHKTIVCK